VAGVTNKLAKNPALAQHLEVIKERSAATDQDLAKIPSLAGKLSADEGHAIREALEGVQVSPDARIKLDSYMLDEFEARIHHAESAKKRGDIVNVVALGATMVGVPVLNHFLSIGGLDNGVNLAANGVQIAIMAGEYLGGMAAVRAVSKFFSKDAASYGESD